MTERVPVGSEADLKTRDAPLTVVHGDLRIAVFRTEFGWKAIEDRCSHADVRLSDGWVEGHCVSCPWHGAQFDLVTGEALSGPAQRPVRTFPILIHEGHVSVEV
jgi:3-phenylpropionate/trans-cinnamate dioxygenase ferredoxin component